MKLSPLEIKKYIECPKNKKLLDEAAKQQYISETHIIGKHLNEFFERVDGVENEAYIALKKKLASAITKVVYEKVTKPVTRIFSGQGGSTTVDINSNSDTEKQDLQKAIKVASKNRFAIGQDLNSFIEKIWANVNIWVNPYGIILVSAFANPDETTSFELKSIPVYNSTTNHFNIHDVVYTSFDKIEYLILNKGEITVSEQKHDLYKVIDDQKIVYVAVKQDAREDENTYYIVTETETTTLETFTDSFVFDERYINRFGQVPALFNSNRIHKEYNRLFISYCFETFEIARNYLDDFADYRILKKKVVIPRTWEYQSECEHCNGNGYTEYSYSGSNELIKRHCDHCNGNGTTVERTLSDIMRLDPVSKEHHPVTPPFGTEIVPSDILSKATEELDMMERQIYETLWGQGSYVEKTSKETTAFEVSVRNEEKVTKLLEIERNRAKVKERILNLMGAVIAGDKFNGVIIRPATQFVLTSSSEAYKLYTNAKKENAPEYQLDNLYKNYLLAEYENDIAEFEKQVKLLLVNPAPHQTILEAQKAAILTDVELTLKKNFERYIARFVSENETVVMADVNELYETILGYASADLIQPDELVEEDEIDQDLEAQKEKRSAQAKLRGSVGGVQGILQVKESVRTGTSSKEAATSIMNEVFGFDDETSKKILKG